MENNKNKQEGNQGPKPPPKSFWEKVDERTHGLDEKLFFRLMRLFLPILAVISLVFAIIANRESQSKSDEIHKQSERILQSVSIKFEGNFPNQINKISDRISKCEKELTIATDHPGYGCFSNPEHFKTYRDAILEKIKYPNKKFKLTMIIYSKEKREIELRKQFGIDSTDYNDSTHFSKFWKRDTSRLNKLDNFCMNWNKDKDEIKDWETLFNEIERINEGFLSQIKGNPKDKFKILELLPEEEILPVYFWLFDKDEYGIFSFHTYGNLTSEITLSTLHQKIFEYFEDIKSKIENKKRS